MIDVEMELEALRRMTQQFNTTHSMGRLTLNILLSFAQFEREIISERTRDKIAATRRKGKWSGGRRRTQLVDDFLRLQSLPAHDLSSMIRDRLLIQDLDQFLGERSESSFIREKSRRSLTSHSIGPPSTRDCLQCGGRSSTGPEL